MTQAEFEASLKKQLEDMSEAEFRRLYGEGGVVESGHIDTTGLNLEPQIERDRRREAPMPKLYGQPGMKKEDMGKPMMERHPRGLGYITGDGLINEEDYAGNIKAQRGTITNKGLLKSSSQRHTKKK